MANFIFGNPNLFSVNIFSDNEYMAENEVVNFSMCCGGHDIGDSECYGYLSAIKAQFIRKITSYDYSLARELNSLNKDEVVLYLTENYENSLDWKQSENIGSLWLSLDLSPSMDGDIVIWLRNEEDDRLIWKPFDKKVVSEMFLPKDYILETIQEVIK